MYEKLKKNMSAVTLLPSLRRYVNGAKWAILTKWRSNVQYLETFEKLNFNCWIGKLNGYCEMPST